MSSAASLTAWVIVEATLRERSVTRSPLQRREEKEARERAREPARQRVVHDEIAHLEQRSGAHAADPARWQAAW